MCHDKCCCPGCSTVFSHFTGYCGRASGRPQLNDLVALPTECKRMKERPFIRDLDENPVSGVTRWDLLCRRCGGDTKNTVRTAAISNELQADAASGMEDPTAERQDEPPQQSPEATVSHTEDATSDDSPPRQRAGHDSDQQFTETTLPDIPPLPAEWEEWRTSSLTTQIPNRRSDRLSHALTNIPKNWMFPVPYEDWSGYKIRMEPEGYSTNFLKAMMVKWRQQYPEFWDEQYKSGTAGLRDLKDDDNGERDRAVA